MPSRCSIRALGINITLSASPLIQHVPHPVSEAIQEKRFTKTDPRGYYGHSLYARCVGSAMRACGRNGRGRRSLSKRYGYARYHRSPGQDNHARRNNCRYATAQTRPRCRRHIARPARCFRLAYGRPRYRSNHPRLKPDSDQRVARRRLCAWRLVPTVWIHQPPTRLWAATRKSR